TGPTVADVSVSVDLSVDLDSDIAADADLSASGISGGDVDSAVPLEIGAFAASPPDTATPARRAPGADATASGPSTATDPSTTNPAKDDAAAGQHVFNRPLA